MSSHLRCAYVTSRYPVVTHTFVLREVLALRRRGVDVRTVTVRQPADHEVLGPLAEAAHAETFALRPVGAGRLLRSHLRAVRRTRYLPRLVETLRHSPGGPRGLLWQLFYFAQAVLLWDWMRQAGIEHAHAHHANVAADVAMIAARLGGAGWSWSFTLHGPTEFADPAGHKLALKASSADAVIAISEYARSEIRRLAPDAAVHVVHCGLELSGATFGRRRERSPGEALHVLNVAQMQDRKGQRLLVEALAALGRPARLTIVGDGPARAEIQSVAAALGVDAAFPGAVPQERVQEYYEWADVFCLPSFAEGVPIVLMEAMASGIPVVATAIAGVPELIEDGESGLLVPAGDVAALAAALRRIADDPALTDRLTASARRAVEVGFDIDASAALLEEAFRSIRRRATSSA